MDIPRRIQRLSDIPGAEWTPSDVQALKKWLSLPQPMKTVWFCAARYLGKGATDQDIEDASIDIFTIVDQARVSYRPGGPSFVVYLLHVCFRNNCIYEGKKIRKRLGIETPFEFDYEDRVLALNVIDTSAEGDPERQARNSAFSDEIVNFLNAKRIPDKQREAFILRYLEGMSHEMIAQALDAPLGSVKGWLNRATTALRKYLEERGWS